MILVKLEVDVGAQSILTTGEENGGKGWLIYLSLPFWISFQSLCWTLMESAHWELISLYCPAGSLDI